jgi:O-antigen/teichoic acid export membrane protein
MVLSVVSAVLVARLLGPDGKGVVALAMMVPSLLATFLAGGIASANVYMVGSGRLSVREVSGASISFALLASLAGAMVVSVLSMTGWLRSMVPSVPPHLQMLAMTILPLYLFDGCFTAILVGLQRITTVNVLGVVTAGLNLLGAVLFIVVCGWGTSGAVGAFLASSLVSLMVKGLLLWRIGAQFRPSCNLRAMRLIVTFGVKGQAGNILQFFNYRLDTFVLNYFRGPGAVGIYGVAVAVAELLWQLPNAVSFVIFPKAAASQSRYLNAFTPKVLKATLALTATGALALALGGRALIKGLYSSAFAAAYAPLLGLLPGVVLLGAARILASEMAGRGFPHYNSAVSGAVLAITILLDFLLIPRWGALGAAGASSVAYTASFLLSLVLHRILARKASLTAAQVPAAASITA